MNGVGSDKGEEIGVSGSDKLSREGPCQEVMLGLGSRPDDAVSRSPRRGHSDNIDHGEINYSSTTRYYSTLVINTTSTWVMHVRSYTLGKDHRANRPP